jgi:hypothetical protein
VVRIARTTQATRTPPAMRFDSYSSPPATPGLITPQGGGLAANPPPQSTEAVLNLMKTCPPVKPSGLGPELQSPLLSVQAASCEQVCPGTLREAGLHILRDGPIPEPAQPAESTQPSSSPVTKTDPVGTSLDSPDANSSGDEAVPSSPQARAVESATVATSLPPPIEPAPSNFVPPVSNSDRATVDGHFERDAGTGLPPEPGENPQNCSPPEPAPGGSGNTSGKPLPRADCAPESMPKRVGAGYGPKQGCIPGLQLPEELERFLIQMSNQFEIPPLAALLVTMAIMAAALGDGVVLATPLGPISGSLACALWDDEARIRPLVDILIQPFRDAADARLAELGEAGLKGVYQQIRDLEEQREAFFESDPVRDAKVESRFNAKVKALRALLRPALILENPAVGSLYQTVARGGGALALYHDSMVGRLLDAPKKGGADFDFLTCAVRGRTPENSFLPSNIRRLVRPSLSSVLICSKQRLEGLLCSGQPKVLEFKQQLLLSGVVRHRVRAGVALDSSSLRSWGAWIGGLLSASLGPARRLTLSPRALGLMGEYGRKLERGVAAQRHLAWVPILAAKLSMLLHCFLGGLGAEISETTMRISLALAECLRQESASTARGCMTEQNGNDLDDRLDRMEEKISQMQPVRFRKLRRSYDVQEAAPHRTVLDELVRRGRARVHKNGLIETVPTEPRRSQCSSSPTGQSDSTSPTIHKQQPGASL